MAHQPESATCILIAQMIAYRWMKEENTVQESGTSAAERAYQVIRDGILDGVYGAGSMLGESSLATEIGVSRTPVRTALARLQNEGWITIYPKRGALVQGLSERAVLDLTDARLMLESASVERATSQTRTHLAVRLSESIVEQTQAFQSGDLRHFIEATISFHRTFVESSGNAVLLELNDRLEDRQRFLLFSYGDRLLSRCAEIIAEHRKLVEHWLAGDAIEFSASLHHHLAATFGTTLTPTSSV